MPLIKAGERVVLEHETTKQIVVATLADDFELEYGFSSYFKVTNVTGLSVEEATLNSNIWPIVNREGIPDDNGLSSKLVDVIEKLLGKKV